MRNRRESNLVQDSAWGQVRLRCSRVGATLAVLMRNRSAKAQFADRQSAGEYSGRFDLAVMVRSGEGVPWADKLMPVSVTIGSA